MAHKNDTNEQKKDGADGKQKSEMALREEEVLAFWEAHDIFHKTLTKDAPNGEYVFYDGPPFATGLPHYGHILASTIKDTIPRYRTMRGYHVKRKWGWDCHGLPLENVIEKELGLKTKKDIEEHGIENFNEAARDAVLRYADEWRRIIPRMGRFVDMEDDYRTLDASYTESVWWVFCELHKKGLVYEGFKSMHLCPRCGTTLSNFEVNQGYEDIKDIAVTVALPLTEDPTVALLVWTTTPWTLPGNMAAAVHADHTYVYVTKEDADRGKISTYILAKEMLPVVFGDDETYTIQKEITGAQLVGKTYEPPFSYYKEMDVENKENAWTIYHAPYVELGTEGTGAVHLAPAYGEEDMELAKEHGIPIVHHVGEDGRFLSHVTDFAGESVKPRDDEKAGVSHLDTDIKVLKHLQEAGKIFKKENITHSYPHCWRCDTPLLNYATTSWFVEVTALKDQLVEENQNIHWVPEHVGTARFGKWLAGARDWAVSRQRYWGAPLPIWRNERTKEFTVIGSLQELKEYVPQRGNTYHLMRHGEALSNTKHTIRTDVNNEDPLTEKGKEQVEASVAELKKRDIDLILVSPFTRTKDTAEMVRAALGLSEEQVIVDERIQEMQVGSSFEGKHWDTFHTCFDTFTEQFTTRPEGVIENRADVQKRAGAFLYDIDAQYKDKNILIIGHVSSTYALACAAAGADIRKAVEIKESFWLLNAEVRELPFTPLPHNREYELDFHRPYIDEIELYDKDGTKLERVPDVFDCWFESGSMPYAQMHYPFTHTDAFDPKEQKGYPADFIAEGLDQTRGWFYSLIVLGTALFGKSPYNNVIVTGLVLAEDGKKMSKRLQNYPDPMYVADTYGVDTMRFYMLSSSIMRAEDLNFSETQLAELARKNIGRLHNVLAFYELFRDETIAPSTTSTHVLDRWIIARLNELIAESTKGFESYELDRATRPVTDFIDDLSVWYVRRSRDRLKKDDADKKTALATMRYVLRTLAQVIAPSMPFYAEHLFGETRTADDPPSVHLTDWPEADTPDPVVLGEMSIVREFVTLALEERARANIKVRQPLPSLCTSVELEPEYARIVLDEINVKELAFDKTQEERVMLDTTITPELKTEGDARELIRNIQSLRKKEGLTPGDRITIVVDTSEEGKRIIDAHEHDIKHATNVEAIKYAQNEGMEVTIDEASFTVSISK